MTASIRSARRARAALVLGFALGLAAAASCAPASAPAPQPASSASVAPASASPTQIAFIESSSGPVPAGFTRFSGRVVDDEGTALAGVCVYAGPPSGCPSPYLRTNASGEWAFDFPSGVGWDFNFEREGYVPRYGVSGTPPFEVRLEPKR